MLIVDNIIKYIDFLQDIPLLQVSTRKSLFQLQLIILIIVLSNYIYTTANILFTESISVHCNESSNCYKQTCYNLYFNQ